MGAANAAWTERATPVAVGELRRRAAAFAAEAGATPEVTHGVALAVSEAVTNVVVHAYAGREPGPVTVTCRIDGARLVVEVRDEGPGVAPRRDSPGVGQGLSLIGALAQGLQVSGDPSGSGTVVGMSFELSVPAQPSDASRLTDLCALALERVADVSCVDVVSGGVLRRAAAQVAGDPALTEWLRGALPPAKPGTATWAAMREGGARLVVHDPDVPRSPGGTGERLDLRWWVAVPLAAADGSPAALWGLGGRRGGRPIPSDVVIEALTEVASTTDLAQPAAQRELRARLQAR